MRGPLAGDPYCMGTCSADPGRGGAHAGHQSAPHMHVLVCRCSNVLQVNKGPGQPRPTPSPTSENGFSGEKGNLLTRPGIGGRS